MTRRLGAVLAAAALLAMPAAAHAAGGGHDHGDTPVGDGARVGLLLADHGEPPVYDENTYYSFREFVDGLIDAGVIPAWLRFVDTGTIAWDAACPGCDRPHADPELVDAWLRPHPGPATFVPASSAIPAHYVIPGGPGLGEPDVFEHAGLRTGDEYARMGGRSPNYDEKLPRTRALLAHIRTRYGQRLPVRVGAMIDPRIGGRRQGITQAVEALVRRDRVDALVVAYLGVGFSDIMQTHHLRHHLHRTLERLGVPDLPVRYAEPLGTTPSFVNGVVERVRAELAELPPEAAVAIQLSGHGLPTAACGDYACGEDAYHRSSAGLFARTSSALRARIRRDGRWGVFHSYGEGADDEHDPEDKVDSPLEALEKRRAEGYTHVIDIPYEFDANSRDTLIVLREGYGRDAPDWDAALQSSFTWNSMEVKIANVSGGDHHKIRARETIVDAALEGLVEPRRAGRSATVMVHDDHFHPAAVTVPRGGAVTWRWAGESSHDLRFRGRRPAGAPPRASGAVRRRFQQPGTYRYVCTLHEGMRGVVRVR